MPEKLVLIGGGGHCKSCIDVIEADGRFSIAGIVDVRDKMHQKVLGYEIFASDDDISSLVREYSNFLITLGQIKSAEKRKLLFDTLSAQNASFPVIIAPTAYVSPYAAVDSGTIVMHKSFVNAGAAIGKNCIINTGAVIEHDTVIGNHCHISIGSVLGGGCSVGDESFIGANSVLAQQVTIQPNSIIGAGTVVKESLTAEGTYIGNPARKIR